MDLAILGLLIIVLCFGFVVFVGAPYLPTLKPNINEALAMLDLRPGQIMLELGSGDGRVLKAAAQRGIKSIGYELNPILVLYSHLSCWRYRKLVKIRWMNFWWVKLPRCDAVYTFLLPKYMDRLDKKIMRDLRRDVKLLSFAFSLPNKKPVRQSKGIMLYQY